MSRWSAGATACRYAAYLLLITMPLTVFVPLTPAVASGVYPMFVSMGVELSDAAALAVLLSVSLADDRRRREASHITFTLPLLALAVLALATTPFALLPSLAAYTACRWLLAVGVCWSLPRIQLAPDRVAIIVMTTLGIHVIVGVGQVIRQGPLGLPGELALEHTQLGAAVLISDELRWLRPYGLTFHPNVLGGFLAAGLMLGLPMVSRRHLQLLWWVLWSGLVLTFSRSAWLATLVCMPIAVLWVYRYAAALRRALGQTLLGALVITLAIGWATSAQVRARFQPSLAGAPPRPRSSEASIPPVAPVGGDSVTDRLEMLRLALNEIAHRPVTGVGAGNFPLAMLSAGSAAAAQYVHNVPLLVAAEVGCAGGAAWVGLWVASGYLLWRDWRRLSVWAVVSVCAWLAIAIIALFDSYPWALGSGRLLTATVLGLIASWWRTEPDENPASRRPIPAGAHESRPS